MASVAKAFLLFLPLVASQREDECLLSLRHNRSAAMEELHEEMDEMEESDEALDSSGHRRRRRRRRRQAQCHDYMGRRRSNYCEARRRRNLNPKKCGDHEPYTSTDGFVCAEDTDKCNPCAGKRPQPEKPDGGYDTMGAVTSVIGAGVTISRAKFDIFKPYNPWGTVASGVMDGVLGCITAGKPDQAAWNVYKLESYIDDEVDYMVCEFKEMMGDYFEKYMGSTELCNYNIGIDSMAAIWKDSCHSRQCLNYTDRAADKRGDCCGYQSGAAHSDCADATDEDIKSGQASCRLNGENSPGTGVCSTARECLTCMTWEMAIEDTKEQINLYKTYPTNWGEALEGYYNVDAIVANAKGTMMMVTFYQELVLLGSVAAMGNFQSFCKTAYNQINSKVNYLMDGSASVVSASSCMYGELKDDSSDYFCANDHGTTCNAYGGSCGNPWQVCPATFSKPLCIFTRMGCARPYSMKGSSYCIDAGQAFCDGASGCTSDPCYFACMEQDGHCMKDPSEVLKTEQQAAAEKLRELYAKQLENVTLFLKDLKEYADNGMDESWFGIYRKVGYRKPSCDSTTASESVLKQCQKTDPDTGEYKMEPKSVVKGPSLRDPRDPTAPSTPSETPKTLKGLRRLSHAHFHP